MKRRIRIRAALAVAIGFMAVLALPDCAQAQTSATQPADSFYANVRAKGIAASAAGDDAAAIQILTDYLRRYPNDLDALTAFANSRLQSQVRPNQAVAETVGALRRILTLAPSRTDERRKLMELYVSFGYMPEAIEQADTLLAAFPDDHEASDVKIRADLSLKRLDEAMAVARVRLAAAPADWIVQLDRLQILQQQHAQPDEISRIAAQAVAGHEGEQGAQLIRGYAARLNGDFTAAKTAFADAAALPATDSAVTENLIQQLDFTNNHAASMKLLGHLVLQGQLQPRLLWLRRLWEDGRFAEAADFASGSAAADLNDTTSLALRADSLRRLGRDDDFLLTQLKARTEDVRAVAWVKIENAVASPGHDAWTQARDACQAAVKGASLDAEYILYFQGNFEAKLGDFDSAVADWQKAATAYRTYSWSMPFVQAAQVQLSRKKLKEAETSIIVAIQRAGAQIPSAVTLAQIWYAQYQAGDAARLDHLNSLVGEILKSQPREDKIVLIHIALLAQSGQTEAAAQAAKDFAGATPVPSAEVLLGLIKICQQWKLNAQSTCEAAYLINYGPPPKP